MLLYSLALALLFSKLIRSFAVDLEVEDSIVIADGGGA